jgi:predicted NBD/HSP70 family sugar kinase
MSEPVLVAGLDVGGTKTLAVAIVAHRAAPPGPDGDGDDGAPRPAVVATVRRPTGVGGGDRLAASTAHVLADLAAAAGVPVDGFAAVGVGVPGLVDRAAGTVRHAVNLGLDDTPVPLGEHLRSLAHAPVVVDNDVNLAAVGAAVALGCRGDLAYLSVGTGLAAGLVLDGRPRRGAHGAAGEIGHLPVDPQGPLCECGQRGCLEVLASGTAIAARWTAADGDLSATSALLAAAAGGDPGAVAVLDDVAGHLAGAVALLAQTVDPEVIVLGGGVAEAGPGLLEAVRRALRSRAARSPVLAAIDLANRVALVPDGVHAGALGAAVFARDHLGTDGDTGPPAGPLTDVSSGTP